MGVLQRLEFEGVEGLRMGRFGDQLNTACILYRIGETVIDTGPPNQWRKVRRFLEERSVEQVLLTHHHEDHGGNGGHIAARWRARLFAHEKGLPLHQNGYHLPLYRRLVWGRPRHKFQAEILPERVRLQDGLCLEPIATPGHAEDQVCFLEPNRGWLFSGDLYISGKPKYLRKEENPNEEIQSLRRVLEHDFDTLFCAHRGIVEKGYQAIKAKLQYLVALREQVRYYQQKGDPLKRIKKRLMGGERFLFWFSLGDFSKWNYIRAFAAPSPHEHSAEETALEKS